MTLNIDQNKINELRSAIHAMANAFARLNSAAEIYRDRPTVFTADMLEQERVAASLKFRNAMDSLKY